MRRLLLRFLVEHNPFYLLSALCMVGGCLLLGQALHLKPQAAFGRLLILLATLQVYEAALIGLGLYLILRRGLMGDGRMLLLIEAAFLVDATMVTSESLLADPIGGALVGLAAFVLALTKAWIVARALGIPLAVRRAALFALEMAALMEVPLLLAGMSWMGPVSPLALYGAWWCLGLLLVLRPLLARPAGGPPPRGPVRLQVEPALGRALAVLPLASLAAHVLLAHWVYRVPVSFCDLSPVLLGLAVALARAGSGRRRTLHLALPAYAIALSMTFPADLRFDLAGGTGVALSPFRLALAAAGLVYVQGLWLHRGTSFAWAAALCGATAWAGPTASAAVAALARAIGGALAILSRWVPRTAQQWGVSAVAAAFLFLGLGGAVSLWKSRRDAGVPGPPPGA